MKKKPIFDIKLVKRIKNGKVIWVIVISGLMLAIVSGVGFKESAIAQRIRCSVFHTQAEAQKAFEQGSKKLDRDHDGIACESLPK